MFRLWGRLVYDGNYTAKDLVICDDTKETRTHKIFRGLNSICDAWNLAVPIWLDSNITDFKRLFSVGSSSSATAKRDSARTTGSKKSNLTFLRFR